MSLVTSKAWKSEVSESKFKQIFPENPQVLEGCFKQNNMSEWTKQPQQSIYNIKVHFAIHF